MAIAVDVVADLKAQDDDGLGWSTLAEARDPLMVVPGATLTVGDRQATALVRIVAVDPDRQIHFRVL